VEKNSFTVEEYATSARVIQLWLDEFCDKSLITTDQIAEAARRTHEEIKKLRSDNEWLMCVAKQTRTCLTCKDASIYTVACSECLDYSKWRFKYKTIKG
jgi:hypothetical protein